MALILSVKLPVPRELSKCPHLLERKIREGPGLAEAEWAKRRVGNERKSDMPGVEARAA